MALDDRAGRELAAGDAADGRVSVVAGARPEWPAARRQTRPRGLALDLVPLPIEEDLLPLAALHDILRHVGLLRLANGVLRPTKAAADEVETVRRLRTWFSSDEFTSLLASDVAAMLSATGPLTGEELARLAAARGPEFDRLFLEFMIRHHEGALVMVEELFATEGAGQEPELFQLANHVDADQRTEIARMRRMQDALLQRGSE